MSSDAYEIGLVSSVATTSEGAIVKFKDGCCAVLPLSHPKYGWAADYLRSSSHHRWFVAVKVDVQNRLHSIAGADRNTVLGIRDNDRDPTVLEVWLEGEAGPYSLRKDHARFSHMSQSLRQAALTGRCVWIVVSGTEVVDVQELSPEQDADLLRLIQHP